MISGVSLNIKRNKDILVPKFSDCLLDILRNADEGDQPRVRVNFELSNNKFILKRASEKSFTNDTKEKSSYLQHSMACPLHALAESGESLEESTGSKGIALAVSVIVESSDNHILLTRRAAHLRSSPRVWVPPGGHLEVNESLLSCGLREVLEETGLDLRGEIISHRVLCLWENVFPLSLGLGKPKSHSLVIYFHVLCKGSHGDLISKMRIDPNEVMAFAWLPPHVVSAIFAPGEKENYQQRQFIWTGGKVVETELKYLSMFNRFIWSNEFVFSGVQCSLLEWFRDYRLRQQRNKL